MLKQISLKNFTIIDKLVVDLKQGMTVITGEAGAGKSIIIDAIGLALGERNLGNIAKNPQERTDFCLTFEVPADGKVAVWLKTHEMDQSTDCIVRRVITPDGKSKCFINDTPTTLQKLKELGTLLVSVHGQHQNQQLFHTEEQRDVLDAFWGNQALCKQVKQLYQQWHETQSTLDLLSKQNQDAQARIDFLNYQLEELQELQLVDNEVTQLEQLQKRLANATHLIESYQSITSLLIQEDSSVISVLYKSIKILQSLKNIDPHLASVTELLQNAIIQTEEGINALESLMQKLHADPEKLAAIETRLSKIYQLARKHRTKPEDLHVIVTQLEQELKTLENHDVTLAQLAQQRDEFYQQYQTVSQQLSLQREKAATSLAVQIIQNLKKLHMPHANFQVCFEKYPQPHPNGREKIEFLVNMNPGQPLQALNKIASGGELSRISLAIQAITAEKHTIPTLIFDEVDVGIGGGTAEVVGELLKNLSKNAQVLTITHQGQVASKGHQHLLIRKTVQKNDTYLELTELSPQNRIEELARMIGGIKITTQTRLHAEEMLK